ncbi:7TM diverse intracellular signaling domain-containing protein [Neolewinella persica]|uniref:7TM diverse intracellular signaling domain-containing protein n=1 Tax=Neolewinella persica TaxID=70998 RepID=UPI00039ED915|nr:7TM diverse intracellular signaling domain-containing protein [Neolewinella persica]
MKSCRNTLIALILFNCLLFSQESFDLWDISHVFTDSTNTLSATEILALPGGSFSPPQGGSRRLSTFHPTYLKFDLPAQDTGMRYLILNPQTTDSIVLLQNGVPIGLTGGDIWIKNRTSPTSRNGFVVPNEADQYLLKLTNYTPNFKSHNTNPIAISLLTSAYAWEASLEEIDFQTRIRANNETWFLSFILIVLILVFISWIILREMTFAYYAMYVTAILVYYLVRRSYLFYNDVFYLPSWLRSSFEFLWIPVILLSYSLFVKAFLETRTSSRNPRILKTLWLAIYLAIGAFGINLILLPLAGLFWRGSFSIFTQLCFAPVTAYLVFLLLRNKDRFSRIIAGGMTLLVFGALLILLNNWLKRKYGLDLEPPPFGFFQYAILGELFIYWIGLIYNWYDLRRETERSQGELKKLRKEMVLRELNLAQKQLIITTPRKQYKWARTQVQGFTADREITHCLLAGGQTVSIPLRLGQVEEQLPEEFIRVQRSYIVNKELIVRLDTGRKARLHLANWPSPIPVGNRFREIVHAEIKGAH